jgi:hypothetical protein
MTRVLAEFAAPCWLVEPPNDAPSVGLHDTPIA